MDNEKTEVKLLKGINLKALIWNSIRGDDNRLFRNLLARVNGKIVDIADEGRNSCAMFVSWIIMMADGANRCLIKTPRATVDSLERDLINSGWVPIDRVDESKIGAVIFWEPAMGTRDGLMHRHVGFYVEGDLKNGYAISNDSHGKGFPHKHHITYGSKKGEPDKPFRAIEKLLWHPMLDDEQKTQTPLLGEVS